MKVGVLLRGWRRTPDGPLDMERIGRYERLALGTALSLVDLLEEETTVHVLAAGSEADDEALAVAHALGAHATYRVWDPLLADVDALGVAQALAHAAKKEELDLLLAGFRSPDHRQGFMGPAVADCLDVPHLTGVEELRVEDGQLVALRTSEDARYAHPVKSPMVLTIAAGPDPGTAEPTEAHQPQLLTLEDVELPETRLRPRMRLVGGILAHTKDSYVTAFVDDAATIAEHLQDVDALL